MNRKTKKTASAIFSLLLAFGVVTPALAKQAPQQDPLRKSQWITEHAVQQSASNDSKPSAEAPAQASAALPPLASALPEYAPGRVIVKYRSAETSVQAESLSAQIASVSPLSVSNAELLKLADGADVNSVIQELLKDPNVLYAEPDYKVSSAAVPLFNSADDASAGSAAGVAAAPVSAAGDAAALAAAAAQASGSPALPNDPLFGEQWGLHNIGQPLNDGTVQAAVPDMDMDLPEAWEITRGSRDVTVAVIGNGTNTEIPDLIGQIWTNGKETPGNGIDDDGDGLIDDVNGWDFAHDDNTVFDTSDGFNDTYGTTVAGQIAAAMNNNEGIAGVAPNVNVMPLKVVSPDGGYFTDVVDAIHYAEAHGVKIAALGMAYGYRSRLIEDAINDASHVLFVAPAGDSNGKQILNTDVTPIYPAAYSSPNILSVTGVGVTGVPSVLAAIGQTSVDVSAPSELILSTTAGMVAGYAAQIDNGTYKAYYNGIGFEEIPENDPEYVGQRQDMFDRAMDYLKPEGVEAPKILLVNDSKRNGGDDGGGGIGIPGLDWDNNNPSTVYPELLQQAGYAYDTFTTQDETADGPPLELLQQYDIVIWFTGGQAITGTDYLITAHDQANITDYLNHGGHLMLTGQDAIDQIAKSPFVQDVLGVTLVAEGGWLAKTWGVPGTIYDGQTYRLMDISLFADIVISNKPEMTAVNLKNSNGNYSYVQGTLYAAAYAAGVAGLVQSQYPDMSALDVKQRIMTSGKTLNGGGRTSTASGKLISAYRALWNKDIPGMTLIDPSITGKLDHANDPNHVYSVELSAGEEATFSLKGDAGTDFDLILYDSSATTVASNEGAVAYSEKPGTSAESITYRAPKKGTYYINVYAVAGAGKYTLNAEYGNASTWLEDDDPSLVYEGDWKTLTDASYSGGTMKQLNGKGSVKFGFRGNLFEWIGTKDDAQSGSEIWIDGLQMGTPDLSSKTPLVKQAIFKMVLTNGHHDVEIIPSSRTGGENPLLAINVDAFVFSSLISPTAKSANYTGPWAIKYGKQYPDGSETYTTTADSAAEFSFAGTKVTLWATTNSNRGMVKIYIDGRSVTPTPVDLYSDTLRYQVPVFTSGELAAGLHKIKIVHAGAANPKSKGSIVTIDGLDVLNLS